MVDRHSIRTLYQADIGSYGCDHYHRSYDAAVRCARRIVRRLPANSPLAQAIRDDDISGAIKIITVGV